MEGKGMWHPFKTKKQAFLPLYEAIAEDINSGKILKPDGRRFSKYTGYNYKTGLVRFRRWEEDYGTIYLEDINRKWAQQFSVFLMEKGYCLNSIALTLARLKSVLRRLEENGIGSYSGTGIKAVGEQVTTIYSTIEDITAMLSLDLHETPGLERIRDVYVMQCFVGLRFGDMAIFLKSPHDFIRNVGGNRFIEIKTQKTGETVVIPIARTVLALLEKYNYDFGQVFSYQYYNLGIKTVAQRAGIKDDIVFSRTEGGMRTDTKRLKWTLMSSHTARRTFATNAFLAGLPEKNIMMITGHKNTSSFHKYIRCTNLDAAIKVAAHHFFAIDLPLTVGSIDGANALPRLTDLHEQEPND